MYLTVLGGFIHGVSIHSGELLREYMAHLYACKVHDYNHVVLQHMGSYH